MWGGETVAVYWSWWRRFHGYLRRSTAGFCGSDDHDKCCGRRADSGSGCTVRPRARRRHAATSERYAPVTRNTAQRTCSRTVRGRRGRPLGFGASAAGEPPNRRSTGVTTIAAAALAAVVVARSLVRCIRRPSSISADVLRPECRVRGPPSAFMRRDPARPSRRRSPTTTTSPTPTVRATVAAPDGGKCLKGTPV